MTRSRFLFFVLGASALFLGACAQQVGDIDRTQANALSKADFEGEWYIRQTVSDVPTTSTAFNNPMAKRTCSCGESFTV